MFFNPTNIGIVNVVSLTPSRWRCQWKRHGQFQHGRLLVFQSLINYRILGTNAEFLSSEGQLSVCSLWGFVVSSSGSRQLLQIWAWHNGLARCDLVKHAQDSASSAHRACRWHCQCSNVSSPRSGRHISEQLQSSWCPFVCVGQTRQVLQEREY